MKIRARLRTGLRARRARRDGRDTAGGSLAALLLFSASLLLFAPSRGAEAGLPAGPSPSSSVAAAHRTAWGHLPADDFILYMPRKYEACLACHPKEMAEEEDFNVDTNWRDTTLGKNLHSLHVYRQPTGVNCAVCHVLTPEDGVRFGERVNLSKVEKGGSCTPACHRPKGYNNAGRNRFSPGK